MGNTSLLKLAILFSAASLVLPTEGAPAKKKANSSKATAQASTRTKAKAKPAPKPAVPVLRPGELPLISDAAIVLDGYTGEPVYEKAADQTLFPASTTKIMTALLVIEAGDLDKEVEVTVEDSKVGESSLSIKPGDRFTRREALYGLMLKSANDIAHMLGRDNAGSMEAFAAKMTIRAVELGAANTRFKNPHGLHHAEHYTTARDLALITRAAMQQPFFRRLVSTITHPWYADSTGPRELWNHNRLLRNFPGCTGVKTGFTNPAQHTLASAALWGTREMVCVVMHSTKLGKWEDSKMLLTYGFSNAPETSGGPAPGTTAAR
jgi:D-alanyl-D-alanine carboxypeptidase (penicillin-binding protein 5/6)